MRYSIEEKDQVLTIRQTLTGRLLSGLATFGFGLGASVVMLVVFYLPDYVGDYSQREGSSTFFAFYIVGTALLIAAIAGIMQALSRSTCCWTGSLPMATRPRHSRSTKAPSI